MIVVDANVILYSVTACEQTDRARTVLAADDLVVVPRLWRAECANALCVLVRRGALSAESGHRALRAALDVFTDRERDIDPEAVWTVALESGLSAYDAEYVALARALGCPLVTNDRRVLTAVPDVALPLLPTG